MLFVRPQIPRPKNIWKCENSNSFLTLCPLEPSSPRLSHPAFGVKQRFVLATWVHYIGMPT